jgi:nucleotide-binding universal stress UspA family protein
MEESRDPGRRVLVPLDGSPLAAQAIPYARAIAAPNAELLLLLVLPDRDPFRGGPTGQVVFGEEDVLRAGEEEARRLLEETAARLRAGADAPRVEIALTVGDPATEILRMATERGADLVVLASRGRGALGRWAFGSVADRVSRASPVPVMVVRPGNDAAATAAVSPTAAPRRLIVPLDGSERAASAVPVAARLAARLGVPVLLVTVVDPARAVSPVLAYGAPFGDGFYDDLRAELRSAATGALEAAAEPLRRAGVAVTLRVLDGSPVAALRSSARRSS